MWQLQYTLIGPVKKSWNKKQSDYSYHHELVSHTEQAPKENFHNKEASQRPERRDKEGAVCSV